MATTRDITITNEWSKVADASDLEVTIQGVRKCVFCYAVVESGSAVTETVNGHIVEVTEDIPQFVTRNLIGSGDIYLKAYREATLPIKITK